MDFEREKCAEGSSFATEMHPYTSLPFWAPWHWWCGGYYLGFLDCLVSFRTIQQMTPARYQGIWKGMLRIWFLPTPPSLSREDFVCCCSVLLKLWSPSRSSQPHLYLCKDVSPSSTSGIGLMITLLVLSLFVFHHLFLHTSVLLN